MGERETGEKTSPIVRVGLGMFVALLTAIVASLVAAILLSIGWDWAPYMHTVALAIVFAAVVLGGIFGGSRARSRGWLVGLSIGACFSLICYLLSLFGGVRDLLPSLGLLRTLAACGTGAIAGMIGVNLKIK